MSPKAEVEPSLLSKSELVEELVEIDIDEIPLPAEDPSEEK